MNWSRTIIKVSDIWYNAKCISGWQSPQLLMTVSHFQNQGLMALSHETKSNLTSVVSHLFWESAIWRWSDSFWQGGEDSGDSHKRPSSTTGLQVLLFRSQRNLKSDFKTLSVLSFWAKCKVHWGMQQKTGAVFRLDYQIITMKSLNTWKGCTVKTKHLRTWQDVCVAAGYHFICHRRPSMCWK